MVALAKKPDQEIVDIVYMDDPKKIVSESGDNKRNIKGFSQEKGTIKIVGIGKRLSQVLNEENTFIEYENSIGDLITINKNAILLIIFEGTKQLKDINYSASNLEIELKRGLQFSGKINNEGKPTALILEKKWFIPVDYEINPGIFRSVVVNKNNIMRIIEHKESL